MARLLMVESWVRSTGLGLPPLIRELGHEFVLLSRDPELYRRYAPPDGAHPVLALAAEVVTAETNDPTGLAEHAADLHRHHRFDGVLTTCDYYLRATSTVVARLGLPGPRLDAIAIATDKHRVRDALTAAGLPNPRYALASGPEQATRAAAELGYPLVAKPVDLNSGTLVRRVDDDATLIATAEAIAAQRSNTRGQHLRGAILVEELMSGPEVSVEAVTAAGVTTVLGVTDKSVTGAPSFVESGHMFPADLPPDITRQLGELVVAALDAIGYDHGLSHTEIMLTPHGPRIVEINPRQGGNYIFDLVRHVTGSSVLHTMVDLALGQRPRPVERPAVPGGLSAAVYFVLSPRDGDLVAVHGLDHLTTDDRVLRCCVDAVVPGPVHRARDNEDYLGHVLAVDPAGPGARRHAERAVAGLRLEFADNATVAPLGPSALGRPT